MAILSLAPTHTSGAYKNRSSHACPPNLGKPEFNFTELIDSYLPTRVSMFKHVLNAALSKQLNTTITALYAGYQEAATQIFNFHQRAANH